jgi:serine/threonine-protein kinase HipA
MRKARISVGGHPAGLLEELDPGRKYRFVYESTYDGPPVSLTMPVSASPYEFDRFPPFFDGLLPEGAMLDGLLRQKKIDAQDYFGQLVAVGGELVGAVTAEEITA